jgi:hypothetical protein
VCGQVDDHPRHVFVAEPNAFPYNAEIARGVLESVEDHDDLLRILAEVQDTTVQHRHMDCCREAGCPTGDCDAMPEELKGLKGYELVEGITGEKVQ